MPLHKQLVDSASKGPVSEESDEVLMVRIAEGDVGAYEALYARYKNRILTFVVRFVGSREWAEDITQDVFLKVYRSPQSFDPRNRFLTWLYAVARNLSIDNLRKRRPVMGLSLTTSEGDELAIEPRTPQSARPEKIALMREMESTVSRLLQDLSPKLREVFILCAMQGLSYEDAAAIVGCPAKTVSSRLSRARKRFEQEFSWYLEGRRKPSDEL